MASANDPYERGFRITQYKIAKTTFWRPIGAPGIFGFDDVYGDTIDAIQEVRDLGYLGSQQSLHLEMPSGTHGTTDRLHPSYYDHPIRFHSRVTITNYKTAAEKAQEHWELVERLRVKARLAESDVLWNTAEAERLIEKRKALAAEKRRQRKLKKRRAEYAAEQAALKQQQEAERLAERALDDARQRAAEARAALAKAEANKPTPAPAIVPATTIPKPSADFSKDFDIPADLLFPHWHDAHVHLARFMAVAEPWTWEVFMMADGRTFIALSNKHFIFDQSNRTFNCGMVVPPGSSWHTFMLRYRLGLATYLNFKRPRLPDRTSYAGDYLPMTDPYTQHERIAWQTECLAAVRLRESQLISQGHPSAAVSLARAFGIRYDGR